MAAHTAGLLVLLGCHHPDPPALTRATLPDVVAAFNAGDAGPRVVVFLSSACASCDTGAAELEDMLASVRRPVTLFAVWEPIEVTDPPPTERMRGHLVDPRVHQIWDPDHLMSTAMRGSELAHPGSPPQARTRTDNRADGIMYDTVAMFSPGARWEATLPAPDYLDVGLHAILPAVRERLLRDRDPAR